MAAPDNRSLEERIRDALEGLQHSHVVINQTTRGLTFEIKVRNLDPFKAADDAIELYERLRKYADEHGTLQLKSRLDLSEAAVVPLTNATTYPGTAKDRRSKS